MGPVAASLHHSHSNTRSEPRLQPTLQLMAMPEPQPTEQDQESNPHPHGYQLGLLPLSHNRNSQELMLFNVVVNIFFKSNFFMWCLYIKRQFLISWWPNGYGFGVVTAVAQIWSLAQELPHATSMAKKTYFLLFFFLSHACSIWNFPGQGSNPNCICDLHHSCGNAGPLTHCARLGIRPVSLQKHHWILDPLHHSGNSKTICFYVGPKCFYNHLSILIVHLDIFGIFFVHNRTM